MSRWRDGAGWVRAHRGQLAYWVALLAVGVGLAVTLSTVLDLIDRADAGRDDRAALRAELERSLSDSAALAEQVQRLGATPVVTPDDVRGPRGERGPRGARGEGPSPEQVAAAVTVYCAGGRCAAPPSDSQVTAAVVAYCAQGRCTGRAGTDGADGAVGEPGPAGPAGPAGEPGPAPTVEQIRASVTAYCADVGCTGPPGEAGPPGRGIDALACDSPPLTGTTRITVTYTDGSTQTVDCA